MTDKAPLLTRNEVLSLAQEAGIIPGNIPMLGSGVLETGEQLLARFSALVAERAAAAERERIANKAESSIEDFGETDSWAAGYAQGVRDIVDGIRAEGGA